MPPLAILGGIGGLASAAAPIVGGAIGRASGQSDRDKELALQQQALNNIMDISTPQIEQMKLALQQYQSSGQLSPEMQQIIEAAPSLMQNISTDPRLREAQMGALSSLQEVGEGGLRPEDMAALAKIQSQTAQDERAREQSILQNMQERGIAAGGAELAAKLSSSQSAANRQAQQGLDVGALASQRALQAIMNAGQLGGQMESQQFGEEAQKAAAQDVINKYNAMNRQQILGQNVGSKNTAQQYNLEKAQRLGEMNVNLSNQEQQANKQLLQQDYENKLRKAQAASNPTQSLASTYGGRAKETAQVGSDVGTGIGKAISGITQKLGTSGLFGE